MEQSQVLDSFVNRVCPPKRFRQEFTHQQRRHEASRQLAKYPTRIPIVLEDDPRSQPVRPNDSKRKYLVPRDMTFGEFIHVVRKRSKLRPEEAIFMFIETTTDGGERSSVLPPVSLTVGALYESHRDNDLFLYVVCATENTFG